MKAFIIEDEPLARKNLIRKLASLYPDIEIVGTAGSVVESVWWLKSNPSAADVIFMDVELSDGHCFDIFRQVKVQPVVVMTTAYDNYAIKAFEVACVDYLLKPVEESQLARAIGRVRNILDSKAPRPDLSALHEAIARLENANLSTPARKYKDTYLVSVGKRLVPVASSEAAAFFSENKYTYLLASSGQTYLLEETIEAIEKESDPNLFFRISRSCLIARRFVESISRIESERLKVTLTEGLDGKCDTTVSRARVHDFLDWIKN